MQYTCSLFYFKLVKQKLNMRSKTTAIIDFLLCTAVLNQNHIKVLTIIKYWKFSRYSLRIFLNYKIEYTRQNICHFFGKNVMSLFF